MTCYIRIFYFVEFMLCCYNRIDWLLIIWKFFLSIFWYRFVITLVAVTYLHNESSARQIFLGDSHSNPRLSFLLENNASLYAAISYRRMLSEELSFSSRSRKKDDSVLLHYIRREFGACENCLFRRLSNYPAIENKKKIKLFLSRPQKKSNRFAFNLIS